MRRTITVADVASKEVPIPYRRDSPRVLYSGLIRLHVLYHACQEPSFGLGMIEELARHGYRLSPGTLYPLLDGLERKGLLRSSREFARGRFRRIYRATPAGRRALGAAKKRVAELFGELFEREPRKSS